MPSAANPVAQVQHSVSADDHVGILQHVLAIDRPEIPLAGAEHHRNDIHFHLVHQAQCKRLPADVAGRETVRSPASSFAFAIAGAT